MIAALALAALAAAAAMTAAALAAAAALTALALAASAATSSAHLLSTEHAPCSLQQIQGRMLVQLVPCPTLK